MLLKLGGRRQFLLQCGDSLIVAKVTRRGWVHWWCYRWLFGCRVTRLDDFRKNKNIFGALIFFGKCATIQNFVDCGEGKPRGLGVPMVLRVAVWLFVTQLGGILKDKKFFSKWRFALRKCATMQSSADCGGGSEKIEVCRWCCVQLVRNANRGKFRKIK